MIGREQGGSDQRCRAAGDNRCQLISQRSSAVARARRKGLCDQRCQRPILRGPDGTPLARLILHLNDALAKPAASERLIFIDVNTPPVFVAGNKPDWLEPVMRRLERYERSELKPTTTAYVWVTNIAFHRQLDQQPSIAASPFGLGMPTFNRPGMVQLSEAYRQKQKHLDAYDIGHSLENYLRFPTTFDGNLPSEAFGYATSRVKIGERYLFPAPDGNCDINGYR